MNFNWKKITLVLIPYLLLSAITLTVYTPSLSLPILDSWDDDIMILNQLPHLKCSWSNLLYWVYHRTNGYYMPTVMYSYMLDGILWNFSPAGMHLQNILWHIAAGAGFYACMIKLGCNRKLAWLGVLLWLIQPTRVESISWLTERKDVVFGALYLWSFRLYLSAESRRIFYWLAILLYTLAVGAKLMAISLPCIICFYEFSRQKDWNPWNYLRRHWPFWIAFSVWLAYALTEKHYFVEYHISLSVKLGTALYNFWFYICQTLWPFNVNPFYGKIIFSSGTLWGICVVMITSIAVGVWLYRTNKDICLYNVLPLAACYFCLLAPVIGFFPLASIDRANRYSYLPAVIIIAGIIMCLGNLHLKNKSTTMSILAIFLLYSGRNIWKTITYQPVWNSVEHIMEYAAECVQPNPVAVLSTGIIALQANNLPKAMTMAYKLKTSPYHSSTSVSLPRLQLFYNYLNGRILYRIGKKAEAGKVFEYILAPIKKDHWLGRYDATIVLINLADCYMFQEKNDLAAECYRQLTERSEPQSFDYWFYTGLNAFCLGDQTKAATNLRQALKINPGSTDAVRILRYIEQTERTKGTPNEKN